MLLARIQLRDFRSYVAAEAQLGERLTVVCGPNGSGKSNLLEAICFGCTGRSPRTRNDRELVRFDAQAARVVLRLRDSAGEAHELTVGFGATGEGGTLEKRVRFDGASVERPDAVPDRPLVVVFVPDRLELINGGPALRRAHFDNLVAALWPTRAAHRVAFMRALSQRNALIARIRREGASDTALHSWNLELGRHALVLAADREASVAKVADGFRRRCEALGLPGTATIEYRRRSQADTAEAFASELEQRLATDLQRGFTTHGPHRDDIVFLRESRALRTYGSQGERRIALLALLLAERAELAETRSQSPLMLLDDVMSELDERRRRLLLDDLLDGDGQSVIATTEATHLPAIQPRSTLVLKVAEGSISREGEA